MIDEAVEHEIAGDICEYHADNRLALRVFVALQTQWRVIAGMGGAIYQGLDYRSIAPVMERLCVPKHRRARLFGDLQLMEHAAITVFNAKDK